MSIDLNLLENTTLRDAALTEGLVIPHPESVISTIIRDYHEQMYLTLLVHESHTYGITTNIQYVQLVSDDPLEPAPSAPNNFPNPVGGLYPFPAPSSDYRPFWSGLNSAILGYLSHPSIPRGRLKDFISSLYAFWAMHIGRQAGTAQMLINGDAKVVWNINGYFNMIKDLPLGHYAPMSLGTLVGNPIGSVPSNPTAVHVRQLAGLEGGEINASRISSNTLHVSEAWDQDSLKLDALNDQYQDVVSDAVTKAIFSNPEPPEVAVTPTTAWDKIFDELNWLWYIQSTNSSYNPPPRP